MVLFKHGITTIGVEKLGFESVCQRYRFDSRNGEGDTKVIDDTFIFFPALPHLIVYYQLIRLYKNIITPGPISPP